MTRLSNMLAGTVLALLVSACASHDVMPIRVPSASNMPSHSQDGDVTVHADAYTSGPRQQATFDETLTNEGVLAVEVLVANRSAEHVNGRPSEARLILSDGRSFAPVPAAAIADEFYSSGNVVVSAIAFGLIGALVSSGAEKSAASARRLDFENKALNNVSLVPGEDRHGFLYFALPRDANRHRSATLRFDLRRGASGAPIPIDVPLNIAGLNLAGSFDQSAYAAAGSGDVPQDPAETSGAGTFSRNCLDPGYSELAECQDYLLAWDAAQARNQINPTAGTSNAARAAVAPTARTGSAGPRVADPALTRGAGSTSRNCLDPGFDQLEECKDYVATWEEDQARGQTSSATGKGPAAGARAAPRRSVSGAITSAVDPVEITGGQRNCTDPAFADLLECRKWLEAWNTAQAEGRPLPPPTAPLSGAAIAAAPVAGAKPARAVEMAAYGVSLARYSERNLAIRSWDQFVERFPLLGAATSRVAATTAADGKAAYILQGMGLTERQAQSICGNMRRAYEFCEVVRL